MIHSKKELYVCDQSRSHGTARQKVFQGRSEYLDSDINSIYGAAGADFAFLHLTGILVKGLKGKNATVSGDAGQDFHRNIKSRHGDRY